MTALDDFLQRAGEVRALLLYVAPEADPEAEFRIAEVAARPFSNGTLGRSCLVLLVSYFEGFLKDLVDESFDHLLESHATSKQLSSHLKGRALSKHIHVLRDNADPAKNWMAMDELVRVALSLRTDTAIKESDLPREEVKRAITSIDPAKINELYRALGDGDLSRGPMSIFGSRLRGLKTVRDNAVHGN